MKRVFKSFLPVAMAMAMVGLAVTQARADRLTLNGGCLGVSCSVAALTIGGGSLSFGTSSFTADVAMADAAGLEFAPEVVSGSGPGVSSAGAETAAKVSIAQLGELKNRNHPTSNEVALLGTSMLWSIRGTHYALSGTESSASLALPISNDSSGRFSVVAANIANVPSNPPAFAKTGTTLKVNGVATSGPDHAPILGGPIKGGPIKDTPAVPEPTTMLLLGTGLVGVAAVLRKRLRGRRAVSK